MGITNNDLVNFLRKKIGNDLRQYATDGYEGIALHTSSIIIAVNDAVCDMFGYTQDEIPGLNAWLLFSQKSAESLMEHLMKKSQEPYTVTGLRKDKSEFEVELKGYDFEIAGEPVRAVALKVL